MLNKNHRLIVISDENWEILRNAGTITDSFNTVITRLMKTGKLTTDGNVATTRSSLAGSPGSTAAMSFDKHRSNLPVDQELNTAND